MLGDVNVIVLIMNGSVEKELVKIYSIIFFSYSRLAFTTSLAQFFFFFKMVRLIISYYILYNKIEFRICNCTKWLHQIAKKKLDLKKYIYNFSSTKVY